MYNKSIGEIVRNQEQNYLYGTTTISKHVQHKMIDTINKIDAYLNSKHITGEKDSKGRKKPFFNVVTSSANIWYRATDIDRSNIKIKPTKTKDVIDAFLATIFIQDWMRKENFGKFLNDWGRVLSRYGSAVIKTVENSEGLCIKVIPWNRLIVDPVDFCSNPVIEILELTESQLRSNENYNQDVVEEIINTQRVRETVDKRRKDNFTGFYKLYEVHGKFPEAILKLANGQEPTEKDWEVYSHQMYVYSYYGGVNKNDKVQEYILYKGLDEEDVYMLTHLIEEDGRTLSIGAVENLFETQWMVNHSQKSIKDQLDLASKMFFQTSDTNYLGKNVLMDADVGDIFVHSVNEPLTQLNNSSHDIGQWANFSQTWKVLGNEINGISEAMLGVAPKAGTAWRQTEAMLRESYSLFELMTENKGLQLETLFRKKVIPYIKRKKLNNKDEIQAVLELNDIERIDSAYIKSYTTKEANKYIVNKILNNEIPTQQDYQDKLTQLESQTQELLSSTGNQRFFKPSEIDDKTWKEQFKDLEWELEIDITGENKDYQSALATLNTALQVMIQPGFSENKQAQLIVNKILEASGTLSPLEISSLPKSTPSPMNPVSESGSVAGVGKLPVTSSVKTQ